MLGAAVLAAVHHAEVVAHRVGEPFGSVVLAVAVTIIEVGLIVTLMISGGPETASLARDTVFAAVMITTNGIVGLALLIGAFRFNIPRFNAEGTGTALATVAALATLTMVLPNFTTSRPGPEFSGPAAGVRGRGLAHLVRGFRGHPDRPAPGLLPADDLQGRGGGERGARRPADRADRPDQPGPAAGGSGRCGRPGQGRFAGDQGRRHRSRLPHLLRRGGDRAAGAARRRPWRPPGRPGATGSRPASTWPSGPRSPASA